MEGVTQAGLLKAFALALIALLPLNAGWSVWRVLDYNDKFDSIMLTSGALWAHNPELHTDITEHTGYRVACVGGCLEQDNRRIRQCIENAWIVEHQKTWESARGYFLRCVEGEGYIPLGCSAGDPNCVWIGKPSLWDPWKMLDPERNLQPDEPEFNPKEDDEEIERKGQIV